MKFLIIFALAGVAIAAPRAQDATPEVAETEINVRAPSTYQNCDCQCDSYTWSSKGKVLGNCLSADATLANFCYISGRAVQACRDVKISESRTESFSHQGKYYSYEACATPPRNQCFNIGGPFANSGDGDRPQGFGGPGPVGPGPIGAPHPPTGGLAGILGIRTAGEGESTPAPSEGDAAPAGEGEDVSA